jgi:UDP-N-acetylglucosamine--N-acetylmuramyl-(pentapeptide) pyrophosphoryl-undecaprenol N-acetylglucosamine transferase
MNKKINTVVFAGGGTGGHIYPGLAIAAELRALARSNGENIRICWFGNSTGMDKTLVQKDGCVDKFYGIPSGKLRRYFSIRNFADLFKIAAGFAVSFIRLAQLHPSVLFSKGGFVSVPPCAGAHLLHIPVFTHECDFTPGLATRLNSRFASKIFVSYQETKNYLNQAQKSKTVVTGNPVRPVFYNADSEKGKKFLGIDASAKNKPVLLVIGGSLGAHQINQLVWDNIDWLCERFTLVHQVGSRDVQLIPPAHEEYYPYAFIYDEMPDVIAAADIVLSRAGANSLWECAVLGKPLVLIPLCGSGTRGDQVDNAEFFETKGAALVLNGDDADSVHLQSALEKMKNDEFRANIASSCKSLANQKRPAAEIARLVYEQMHCSEKK